MAVRLFYDFLVEEGVRESNPVGRGRYGSGRGRGGAALGLVPRLVKLPIPAEAEWLRVLDVFWGEPVRNRVMLALAYDSALRREELCALRTAVLVGVAAQPRPAADVVDLSAGWR